MVRVMNNRRVYSLIIRIAIVITLLAACGRVADEIPGQDRNGGYIGLTERQSNAPLHPIQQTNYEDAQTIRRMLLSLDHVRSVQTITKGSVVYVYLHAAESLSEEQEAEMLASAKNALNHNNPRYEYRVYIVHQ